MSTKIENSNNPGCVEACERVARTPRYRVRPNPEAYEVEVTMPGIDAKRAEIVIENGELVVTGRRGTAAGEDWKTVYREIPDADYKLRLQLNVDVDEAAISAASREGVLTITLPITEAAKPRTVSVE